MDHILSVEVACLLRPDPDLAPPSKLQEGNLFNWTVTQPARQSAVLHDPPLTHVDAVMRISSTRRREVRADGRFTSRIERFIGGPHVELPSSPCFFGRHC